LEQKSLKNDLVAISQSCRDTDTYLNSLAKNDVNVELEYYIKDAKGVSVVQSQIHREIQYHIDECEKRGIRYCGILAPWGHGKTEQVVIGRTLRYLGQNCNDRIFVVCNTDDNAKSRVASVSRYILEDKDYHKLYPSVKPAKLGDWTKHKIIIDRESKSKDGSVEAWGVTTSGTGSRCDKLLVDDPVDLRNAILNPALRQQVKDSFYNVWLSRVSPDGFVIYIATMWHNDDLTSDLLVNPEWKFLTMKIAEDFESIECDSAFKGKFNIPLWNSYWDKEALLSRLKVIGKRAFNRGFRQQAMTDEDKTFPSSEKIFKEGITIKDIVQPGWPRVMGIDPFGQWVVLFTLAYNPHGFKRYPVEIIRRKFGPTETVNEIIKQFDKHRHQVIVCENNAAQDAIVQWAKEKGRSDMPIVPFVTGIQKADPEIGLPSLDVEFENGAWTVAMGERHAPDCECGFCVWRKELDNHPVAKAADTVMASWFAREGVRYIAEKARQQQVEAQVPDYVDAEELGVDPVVIGGHY